MKRKTLFLVLCALLALSGTALAEIDMDYTGRVDPITGSPYGLSKTDGGQGSGRVQITETMYYDWDAHDFAYTLPNVMGELHANVADGMITNTPVRVTAPVDAGVTVYRDGEEYTGDCSAINERGEYVVHTSADFGSTRVLSFTILGARTNALEYFSVPEGFWLLSVRFGEGEEAEDYPTRDRYSAALSDEGTYHIEYQCVATSVVYTLDTVIDRTEPDLLFDGAIDDDGNVHSALTFTGLEEGDYISLTHEGEPVKNVEINSERTGGVIYDPGSYILQVFDAAGNMTQYEFTIMMYFNAQSWVFVGLVALVLAGVVIYTIVQRKRLKFG